MYSASLTPKSLLPDMISVFLSVHLCITPLTNTGALRWPAYRSASRQPQYLKLRTVRDIVLCSLLLKYYFEGWIWSSRTYHSGEKNQKKTTLFDAVLVEKASLLTFMKNDVNAFVKDTIHTAHCISYISAIETHTHTHTHFPKSKSFLVLILFFSHSRPRPYQNKLYTALIFCVVLFRILRNTIQRFIQASNRRFAN